MLRALTIAETAMRQWWPWPSSSEPAPARQWPPGAISPYPNRQALARRWAESARGNYLASASPTIVSLCEKWASHCIASGPSPRSAHPDEPIRRALESVWNNFATRSDIEGTDDLIAQLNVIIRTIIASGEIFVRMVTTKRGELRLQLLSPEQIDPTKNEELQNGAKIISGIEYNSAGERVAYHILPDQPDMLFSMVGPAVRVPALCYMDTGASPGLDAVSAVVSIILLGAEASRGNSGSTWSPPSCCVTALASTTSQTRSPTTVRMLAAAGCRAATKA
jgi:hypothetical protein